MAVQFQFTATVSLICDHVLAILIFETPWSRKRTATLAGSRPKPFCSSDLDFLNNYENIVDFSNMTDILKVVHSSNTLICREIFRWTCRCWKICCLSVCSYLSAF